ncbi:hypothetical protein MBLNU459_g5982t1 [Dothideomycetes sp. NU459]
MPALTEPLRIVPLSPDVRKSSQIGAEVVLPTSMACLELDGFSDQDKDTLRRGLYDNNVLVIRNQTGLSPEVLPQLGRLFDETAWNMHSGGLKAVIDPKNILAANRAVRIPRAPQVTVIGQGNFDGYEGVEKISLKHVDHTEFHEEPLSTEDLDAGFTRPYRWHMDAPLYDILPGRATILHSLENPESPDQRIRFPDGECMDLAAGATAFYSGARNFQLLTPEEKRFALNTTVQYAPRAYEWIRDCKATADGMSIAKAGREKDLSDLQDWTWDKVQSFPMVWRNHGNGQPHLQILGCCVWSLITTDPDTGKQSVIDDIEQVRAICHRLQSKVYEAENVYAHRWQKGDLVIFYNQGVLHSITGQLSTQTEKRLFWQCNMASGTPPEAFRG